MPQKKDLTTLYYTIESVLDMTEVERILMVLDKDKVDFDDLHNRWNDEKRNLTLLDRINPFSERDQKGEILKIQVQLDDLINVYGEDRKQLIDMSAKAVYSIPAFLARKRMNELEDAIESISAGGNMVFGRDDAQQKRKKLDISLIEAFGDLYVDCPKLDKLISGFMDYLFALFHLPSELKR